VETVLSTGKELLVVLKYSATIQSGGGEEPEWLRWWMGEKAVGIEGERRGRQGGTKHKNFHSEKAGSKTKGKTIIKAGTYGGGWSHMLIPMGVSRSLLFAEETGFRLHSHPEIAGSLWKICSSIWFRVPCLKGGVGTINLRC